jgi:hypothetical protein
MLISCMHSFRKSPEGIITTTAELLNGPALNGQWAPSKAAKLCSLNLQIGQFERDLEYLLQFDNMLPAYSHIYSITSMPTAGYTNQIKPRERKGPPTPPFGLTLKQFHQHVSFLPNMMIGVTQLGLSYLTL